MNFAPGSRPVAVHAPRAVYWKIPFLPPVASQPADRAVARAHVRRDHRDVNVGQAAGHVLERVHQHGKVPQQALLRQPHRRRVVDQEQQIDVAVQDHGASSGPGRLGHDLGPLEAARRARGEHGHDDGQGEPTEHANQPATTTKRTSDSDDGHHGDLLLEACMSNRRTKREARANPGVVRSRSLISLAVRQPLGWRRRRRRRRRRQRSTRATPHSIWPAK